MRQKIEKILKEYKDYKTGGLTHATNELLDLFHGRGNDTLLPVVYAPLNLNMEQYEEDLKRRQKEHLDNIQRQRNDNWRPCLHDQCKECQGTGIRKDGAMCVHNISCQCPKCTSSY